MAEQLTYEQKFEYICLEIEKGRPVRKACREFMSIEKFYQMLNADEKLAIRYAHACEARQDKMFDELLQISDENNNDTFVDGNGIERVNQDAIQRSRLMIDTRKWMLAKLAPKKYGDKIEVDNKGDVTHHIVVTKEEAKNISDALEGKF